MDREINNTHFTHARTPARTHTHRKRELVGKTNVLTVRVRKISYIYNATLETQICTNTNLPIHTLRHMCADTHLTLIHRGTWNKRHCQQEQLGFWVAVFKNKISLGLLRSMCLWTTSLIYQYFCHIKKKKKRSVWKMLTVNALVQCIHFMIHACQTSFPKQPNLHLYYITCALNACFYTG